MREEKKKGGGGVARVSSSVHLKKRKTYKSIHKAVIDIIPVVFHTFIKIF